MKLRVIMEIEVSELTDEARTELEDDLNFVSKKKFGTKGFPSDEEEEGYVPTVPTLADSPAEEIEASVRDLLQDGLSDYEAQRELWVGTDFYGWISNVDVQACSVVPDDRVYRMLQDAAKEKLTIIVYDDIAKPDYVGQTPAEAWEHVTACDEINLILVNTKGQRVGWANIVHTGDPDEALADYGRESWIEAWDKANPVKDAGQ